MSERAAGIHHQDAYWMRRALRLARRSAGRTWPNPTVAAIAVRDGELLAEGVHARVGEAHAEAAVLDRLRALRIDPSGCTFYVTLEPCHHEGRTPPCSRRLAESGVARVVFAVPDVSSRRGEAGAVWLREQGIVVVSGILGRQAWELNHPFFETGRDDEVHWTLKLALSADGRLSPRVGRIENPAARAVTGPLAHRRVHRMRADARAVLVGAGTVESDRPHLNVRHIPAEEAAGRHPRSVILDPTLRLDPAMLPGASLVFSGQDCTGVERFVAAGHEVCGVASTGPGRLDWRQIDREMARRGLGVVLVEGGARVATDLLEAGLPHRVHLFLAPRLFGPEAPGLGAVPDFGVRYRTWRVRRVGPDLEWVLRRSDLPTPVFG